MTARPMDIRLKAIMPKAVWGCRSMADKRSILAIADYEYIVPVGPGLMIFDNNPHGTRKTHLVPTHHNEVICVTQMALSFDGKYLINVVRVKNEDDHSVHLLVYTVEHLRVEYRSPRLITYRNPSYVVGGGKMEISCVNFSHDSQYIAIGTNVPAVGVVILDHKKGDVFQVIPTNAIPNHITFNPLDPCKLCVTGNNGLFQFWRVTAKSIHLAPVVGLRGHNLNYMHHIWIPPFADGLVIASTSSGLLSIVLGGEQKGHNVHVFGQQATTPHAKAGDHHHHEHEHRPDEHCVTQIMVRGDIILALSPYNEVVAFEVRRVMQSKGINTLSPSLGLLKRYRLTNVDELLGIDWCIQDSATSFAVVGMSRQTVFQVEVIGDIDQEVSGGITAGDAVKDAISATSADWVNIHNEQLVFKFHGGEVHSLAISARSSTLLTSSYADATVRIWSTNTPSSFRGSWLVESFVDRPQENPFHVDMHPSGLLAICAIEGEVREYAITDEHLELYRKINIKGPFTGPTGTAHMITQPVSIVKYSNGGQYIVVVTGKLAQVFSTNVLEYTHSGGGGFPQRIMILNDHIAPITDVDFNRDDSRIITSSSDGSVYYWKIGSMNRDQEYVFKGMSVNKVALSKTKQKETHIVAVCEAHGEHQSQHQGPAEALQQRRQSMVLQRRTTRHGSEMGSEMMHGVSSSGLLDADGAPGMKRQISYTQPKRKTFLAVWKDSLSGTAPRILALDSEVRCIALGDTEGPDRFDICVLGMADGRVLVSVLPLPASSHRMQVEVQMNGIPGTVLPSPLAAGVTAAVAAVQSQPRGHSRKPRGEMDKSRKGLLATTVEEQAAGEAATVTTTYTGQTGQTGQSSADGDSTVMSAFARDRDDMSIHSRQSSVLDGPLDAFPNPAAAAGTAAHPGSAPGTAQSFREAAASAVQQEFLDEARCRQMKMHFGPVNTVAVSRNGLWIFSAGSDGVVHVYATSKRGQDMVDMVYAPESAEHRFHMIEASKLRSLRSQLADTERLIETNKKDYDLKVDKILESKEKMVLDLKVKMQKEVKQRDETILQSRNEYLKLKNGMNKEIAVIRKQCNDSISDLELNYEQKLSQESLYLDKMKQAYDEYVVHSRMDLADLQRRTEQRIESIEADRNLSLLEAEKQKKTVLQYFDYVKLRNDELMQSLVNSQVEERCKLKEDLTATAKQLEKAQAHLLTGEVQANREVSKLQLTIEEKENDVLKLRSAVDWSQNRILELEQALGKATTELGVRTEMSEKWELKTGEMQQKIIELEKLRKALTTQLHTLRQELGPKEESLMRVTEKLQETDREYELSLQAIAEKEKALGQKSENLNLLQKQVRDLRNATSRKEKVLRRAATLLGEYRFSLEQAYFKAEKRTIPGGDKGVPGELGVVGAALNAATAGAGAVTEAAGKHKRASDTKTGTAAAALASALSSVNGGGEVVEIISQNEGMKTALKRLCDILNPFLNEENTDAEMMDEQEQVRQEQERHMYLLHRNVNGLRANLDLAQTVAATKVQNHLSDNQNLLKEVNNLRFEVRNLSMENQRLIAQLEFNNRMNASGRRAASPPGDSGSELLFPQYHQHNCKQSSTGGPLFENKRGSVSMTGSVAAPSLSALEEGPSFDSNGLRSDAEYFNRMRSGAGGAPPAPEYAETAPIISNGPKGFAKKVTKSASTPGFKVQGFHSDPVLEGARNTLDAHGPGVVAALQQGSVGSKRTIAGVPSSYSASASLDGPPGAGSGSVVSVNKNEFARSADDKIAALIELNEQQIRSYKEELSSKTGAQSDKAGAKAGKSGTGGVAASPSTREERVQRALELHGATLLEGGERAGSGGAVQLPSIRKSSNASGGSKKR